MKVSNFHLTRVNLQNLKPDPENARKHPEANISAIKKSLKKFGQRKPIVTWNNYVIAGNGTVEAAKQLGWTEILIAPVPAEWSHEQARAYSLADNQTSDLAEWDSKMLRNQLLDLDAVGYEVTDLGFEPIETFYNDTPLAISNKTCETCGRVLK